MSVTPEMIVTCRMEEGCLVPGVLRSDVTKEEEREKKEDHQTSL